MFWSVQTHKSQLGVKFSLFRSLSMVQINMIITDKNVPSHKPHEMSDANTWN